MHAVRFHEHGGPEKLIYEECDDPKPGPGEALIEVKAVAINRSDLWVRQGIPAFPVTLPHILGSDIAGTIIEGDGLEDMKAGDEVVVYPGYFDPCAPLATKGKENLCDDFKIIGGHLNGGYAQKVVVPSRNLVAKPAKLDWVHSAAFPITFLTAWHMLASRVRLTKGETVLIIGASSGVGSAALQIACYLGAHVIAVTTHKEKAVTLEAMGADEVVACHPPEIANNVRALTNGAGVDVVLEHVGPATWEQSMSILKKGGRLVTCGATTGPEVQLVLRQLFDKELSIFGSTLGTLAEMKTITSHIANKNLKPLVHKVFPLKDAAAAHEEMLSKTHIGKLVLEVD